MRDHENRAKSLPSKNVYIKYSVMPSHFRLNCWRYMKYMQILPEHSNSSGILSCTRYVLSSEKLSPSHLRRELRWQLWTIFLGHFIASKRVAWYINKFSNGEIARNYIKAQESRVLVCIFLLFWIFICLMRA